jgi:uncharacterized phage protein (TIGR02216 family)
MIRRLDWAGLMRAGLVGLRLAPEVFWRLTPAELMLMLGLGQAGAGGAMRRARLNDLLRAFPDKGPVGRSGGKTNG